MGTKWKDLSPRTRGLLSVAAAVEAGLKIAALIDLKRRPAAQVRGPKWAWGLAITVANSAGAVPILYLVRGRRTH
jgi:hypothetical protein